MINFLAFDMVLVKSWYNIGSDSLHVAVRHYSHIRATGKQKWTSYNLKNSVFMEKISNLSLVVLTLLVLGQYAVWDFLIKTFAILG